MKIGDKLPEFLGVDHNGKQIKSSDFRGKKLLLYTYPKANTTGCTAEACSLQQHAAELESRGYAIVGVSKDKAETQAKFAQKYNLSFPLIADTETSLLNTLGAWGERTMCGKTSMGTIRTTFLVNEEGFVEKVFSGKEIKTKEHGEQVLSAIAELGK